MVTESLDRAFDAAGKPTPAAEGFARGQGLTAAQLVARDNYVWALRTVAGRPTAQVLPELCVKLLDGMRWPKAQPSPSGSRAQRCLPISPASRR